MRHISKFWLSIFLGCLISCKSKPAKQLILDSASISSVKSATQKSESAQSSSIDKNWLRTDDTTFTVEKIVFPNFDLKIKNFEVVVGMNGINYAITPQEKIDFNKNQTITITENTDTSGFSIEDNLDNKLIEIAAHEKSDQFKVFYCYEYIIEYEKGGAVYIKDTTTYKPIKDSAYFFFRTPQFISPTNEIKTRLKVTDSIIKKGSGDYGEYQYPVYVVKGKSLVISNANICLKIERFRNNALVETKLIYFYDFDPD
jgi:hypothetical protein